MSAQLDRLPKSHGPGNNVIFVRPQSGWYVADMIQTDPFLRGKDLVLISQGPQGDRAFLQRNWPHATRTESNFFAESWYLGDEEHRKMQLINPALGYSALAFGAILP